MIFQFLPSIILSIYNGSYNNNYGNDSNNCDNNSDNNKNNLGIMCFAILVICLFNLTVPMKIFILFFL